jgi:purine-binding chemotaxis protein CheW
MSSERKICTFFIDKFFFGIDIYHIQEVIRYQEMTAVPLSHETISGLINMRGQIVTAINMRKRLGFPSPPEDHKPTNIIVRTEDGGVSLLVDGIGDVIDIANERFETPADNLHGAIKDTLKEVCQHGNQLLLILDINQVLNINQGELAAIN